MLAQARHHSVAGIPTHLLAAVAVAVALGTAFDDERRGVAAAVQPVALRNKEESAAGHPVALRNKEESAAGQPVALRNKEECTDKHRVQFVQSTQHSILGVHVVASARYCTLASGLPFYGSRE